jgi:hypothetical protein
MQRVTPDGYLQESLTGAYDGMFCRTIGAMAKLLDELGQLPKVKPMLTLTFNSMTAAGMERVPHVIDKPDPAAGRSRICCDVDQIDGQAHVILSWAMLAHAFPNDPWLHETFPFIRTLTNRSSDAPYLSRCTEMRIEPGLVLNQHLEHSREWHAWFAYDFLSQSFVAAALVGMEAAATQLGDPASAERWRQRRTFLEKQIGLTMVRQLDDKPVYAEMLLPTGKKPEIFPGLGWLNLAPIPSGWTGFDPAIFRNTLDAWHQRATINWGGPTVTACDWLPEGHTNQTYGKMLGWDLIATLRAGDYGRVVDMLDFLEQINTAPLYAEIFNWHPTEQCWKLRDAGNGEQAAWLSWAMLVIRREAGLSNKEIS